MAKKQTRTKKARLNGLESLTVWMDAGLKEWAKEQGTHAGMTLTSWLTRLLHRERRQWIKRKGKAK